MKSRTEKFAAVDTSLLPTMVEAQLRSYAAMMDNYKKQVEEGDEKSESAFNTVWCRMRGAIDCIVHMDPTLQSTADAALKALL